MKHSKLGKEIIEGLKEIIEIQEKRKLAKLNKNSVAILPIDNFKPEEIKLIRQKFEMSASVFAKMLGISSKTVEAWESGLRKPTGAYSRLLQIIIHDPKTIKFLVNKK
jgi:putative transcriptional regulator